MIARLAALLCLLALAAPGVALGGHEGGATPGQGGGAFDPLPPAPPEQPTTEAPVNPADDDGDGLSPGQQLLIGISGIVLLLGIAWAILRDARSAAPAERAPAPGEEQQRKGSQKPAGARHRQSRAKAKAARQARKKARKR